MLFSHAKLLLPLVVSGVLAVSSCCCLGVQKTQYFDIAPLFIQQLVCCLLGGAAASTCWRRRCSIGVLLLLL